MGFNSAFKGLNPTLEKKIVLREFANIRKATISFVVCACLTVRMKTLGSHWSDFRKMLYRSVFRRSCWSWSGRCSCWAPDDGREDARNML